MIYEVVQTGPGWEPPAGAVGLEEHVESTQPLRGPARATMVQRFCRAVERLAWERILTAESVSIDRSSPATLLRGWSRPTIVMSSYVHWAATLNVTTEIYPAGFLDDDGEFVSFVPDGVVVLYDASVAPILTVRAGEIAREMVELDGVRCARWTQSVFVEEPGGRVLLLRFSADHDTE